MALRGALTHRKTRRLAKILGIQLPFALGLMETLWHVTSERAPTGAIGQLTDKAIAEEMFYDGDSKALIAAFVEAEIIDKHSQHRLVIHGWTERADQSIKRKLARHDQSFADTGIKARKPAETSQDTDEQSTGTDSQEPDVSSQSPDTSGIPESSASASASASPPQTPRGGLNGNGGGRGIDPWEQPDAAVDWAKYHDAAYAFFNRLPSRPEWEAIRDNLRIYHDHGDLPPLEVFEGYCLRAREEFIADRGEKPRAAKPLIDFLAALVAERNGE